jgi:hypothetical protein
MLVANGKALGGPPVRRFAPSPAYQFDGQQFSEPLRMLAQGGFQLRKYPVQL